MYTLFALVMTGSVADDVDTRLRLSYETVPTKTNEISMLRLIYTMNFTMVSCNFQTNVILDRIELPGRLFR